MMVEEDQKVYNQSMRGGCDNVSHQESIKILDSNLPNTTSARQTTIGMQALGSANFGVPIQTGDKKNGKKQKKRLMGLNLV